MTGERRDGGLDDELRRIVTDYREASSPSEAARTRLWDRIGPAPVVATPGTAAALKLILGSVTIAAATAIGLTLVGSPPQRDRIANDVPDAAQPTTAESIVPAESIASAEPIAPAELIAPPVPSLRSPIAPDAAQVPSTRSATSSPRADATIAAPAAATNDLSAEVALLQRARVAIGRGDAEAGLRAVQEHERSFPNGTLVQERRAIRILALCDLGKTTQGRAEARTFLASGSNGAFSGLIRDACDLDE